MEPCQPLLAKVKSALCEKVRIQHAPFDILYEAILHDYKCNSARFGSYAGDMETKKEDLDMPQTHRTLE